MNSVLLDTINGKPHQRPPFWYMRQAGRVLPNYNRLKEKHTFWELMRDPQLAAEVTLMPVHDLEVDAAILFSDILVIPYAMGMGLEFSQTGPVFEKPLKNIAFSDLKIHPDASKLQYIFDAIDAIIATRPENTPLVGFCGGPLTLLCYMIQGLGTNHTFPDAINYIYKNRKETRYLVEALTDLSIEYLEGQANHGADVFQLFETHAGLVPSDVYRELFLPSVKRFARAARDKNIPFIFFPKGLGTGLQYLAPEHCDYVSIDWQVSMEDARRLVHPQIGLQGNLDPRLLFAEPSVIAETLDKYIAFGSANRDWIFNLGHGFMPGIPYENALFVSQWIKNADWKR